METPKETLVDSLQSTRDAVVWEVEGLDEYSARRPRTPTGTNLLGLVKHLVAETHRHAGHADIVRESIDGAAGRRPGDPSLDDGYDGAAHVARVEEAARTAAR